MALTAPALVTGSELVTVDPDQAGDWQRELTTVSGRLPVGGIRLGSAAAGWPATTWSWPPPRTLSALT
jgi:hypothetical protein